MEISIYLQPFHAMKNLVIGGWTERLQLTDRAVYQKVAQKGCCMQATKNTVSGIDADMSITKLSNFTKDMCSLCALFL